MTDKKLIETVDMTPSWSGIVNVYLGVLENPNARPEAREAALSEIRRMATIADAYIAMQAKLTEALNNGSDAINELAAKLRNPRSQQKEKE